VNDDLEPPPPSDTDHDRVAGRRDRYERTLASTLLIGVVALLYGPIVGYPWSPYDDPTFILTNPAIVSPGNVPLADLFLQPHIGYIVPVTGLTEAALYALGDGAPWPFHLASLLLHGVSVLLLARLAERLVGDLRVATVGALLFAVHPVLVEPVAWATGLKDQLMTVCALGATLLFVAAEPTDSTSTEDSATTSRRRTWMVLGAAGLALLTVLAKPTGALLAGAWLAWLFARALRDGTSPEPARLKAAILIGLVAAIVTAASWYMHNTLLVDEGEDLASGGWLVFLALGVQLHHLVWPDGLYLRYPIRRTEGLEDPHVLLGLLAATLLVVALWRARKRPAIMLGLALAIAAYLPVSNITPFPRVVADSYMYLPLAGLVLALCAAVAPWLQRAHERRRRKLRIWVLTAAVLVAGALGARAAEQVSRWESPVTLWYPAAADNDDWAYAWMQMAEGLRFHDRHEDAIHAYEQLYAREYVTDYLHKFALTLLVAGELERAECLMVEDLVVGPNRRRALHNYAAMLVSNPEHEVRHPHYARGAIAWAQRALAEGALEWPPAFLRGLDVRLAQARSWPEAPRAAWTPRRCPSLRAQRIDGPPEP